MKKSNNYNNAFAETIFIIKCLPYNEQNRISKKFVKFLEENKNDDYIVNINPNMSLQNQNLLDETKELLKEIYMSYFASEEEKNRILKYDNYVKAIKEDLKNKKYNYDNIFKNNNSNKKKIVDSISMIEYKEPLFKRILEKIKNFFKNKI